ncbi:Gfo/Idh/MocA family oxidoreductase [Spirillospora sp. NPDC048819]|uniref:Gfo/Idh/MocA family protein n=1 Tax=Spirillospora sp. NPDC048819 TaxID=3155268 RepID=UPI0033CFB45C
MIIVGLGTVARTHLTVLERIEETAVLAGVDPAPPKHLTFRDRDVPVYATLRDAATRHEPDLVVITTPTHTHPPVCGEVAEYFPRASVLVEKPAADSFAEARRLLDGTGGLPPVDVAYHMAFSPEVRWGAGLADRLSTVLGDPTSIMASFADPYEAEFDSAQKRFGNSWIDSGINALSVLNRFVEPLERVSLRSLGPEPWSAFEGRIRCRAASGDVEATVLTSWHVTAPARTTRIGYSSGAELVLDHHGVAGHLIRRGTVQEFFGSDGHRPRRESHYTALYNRYLRDGAPVIPHDRSLRLHDVLLRPQRPPTRSTFS